MYTVYRSAAIIIRETSIFAARSASTTPLACGPSAHILVCRNLSTHGQQTSSFRVENTPQVAAELAINVASDNIMLNNTVLIIVKRQPNDGPPLGISDRSAVAGTPTSTRFPCTLQQQNIHVYCPRFGRCVSADRRLQHKKARRKSATQCLFIGRFAAVTILLFK